MRVVADTNIVVSALFWRGKPRQILDAARDEIIELFTSAMLLEELEDVLTREKFVALLDGAQVTAHELVLGYASLARMIEVEEIEPVILADPDDDDVLACAVSAQAGVIVSGDGHLLALKQYHEIRVLTAAEFLAEIP